MKFSKIHAMNTEKTNFTTQIFQFMCFHIFLESINCGKLQSYWKYTSSNVRIKRDLINRFRVCRLHSSTADYLNLKFKISWVFCYRAFIPLKFSFNFVQLKWEMKKRKEIYMIVTIQNHFPYMYSSYIHKQHKGLLNLPKEKLCSCTYFLSIFFLSVFEYLKLHFAWLCLTTTNDSLCLCRM